jgi:Asp-tRNA(Asn)/Glu-tRNA(Gln) amidotransferase C subunit
MGTDRTVDEAAVAALAKAADLPLAEDRLRPVAAQLSDWLTAANELSRKMAAAEHLTVTPITVFTHPAADDPGEKQQ